MTIRLRRDTAANWTANNPVLSSGQPGYEADTGRMKIGDGVTAWVSLAYRFETAAVADGDKGDITVSASGAVWTIDPDAVTYAKMQDVSTGSILLGRGAGGAGNVQEITLGANLSMSGTTLNATSGGVSDGDKGDITVSGGGATWTVDAGAITLSKMANLAASTILGNNTGSPATPIALTPAQVKTLLAIAAGDVSGLAAVATSGSASDLSAGTLLAARFDDTAHGNRAGGSLHPAATGSVAGFMAAADKTKLDAITGTNTGDQTITLTGNVTGSGTGSFAATIAADAVTNAKLANMATATIKGRATAGTGDPEDLTGTQVTALLDTFTSGAKGLVPASGGGTTNFLRADGTFAAPGGGSPGGTGRKLQFNNSGAFDGVTDAEEEGGQLRLPAIATPAAPAAGGVKVYGASLLGPVAPTYLSPSGLPHVMQNDTGDLDFQIYVPGAGVSSNAWQMLGVTTTGSFSVPALSATSLFTMWPRAVASAATAVNAIAGLRTNALVWRAGSSVAAPGGFSLRTVWGVERGGANTTHRAFCGMQGATGAPTDVNPSTLTNVIGMGWDDADANIQILHNDGSGTATKVDLGASFAVPTTNETEVYELTLYSPNSTTQSVSYRVVKFNSGRKTIAAEASGTISTDLPAVTQFLAPRLWMGSGATNSVVGLAWMGIKIGVDY